MNEYEGDRELFHFDMYRLSSGDELFDIVGTSVQYFNEEYLLPHLQDFFNECGL